MRSSWAKRRCAAGVAPRGQGKSQGHPPVEHVRSVAHPEVCFYGLNARRPMAYAKRSKAGAAERLTVLTAHEPRTRALLERLLREHRRKDVQADDLLDSLVGYVTAPAETAAIQRVQGSPACDDHGLPMEMLHLV